MIKLEINLITKEIASAREIFPNNENKPKISEQKKNEENLENHVSDDKKENNENHDNNNENIEKNEKENNNNENIEKNENNNNDKNDVKTSINLAVEDKNVLSAEKDNKKINFPKDNKLSPTNSIHLEQNEFGFNRQ